MKKETLIIWNKKLRIICTQQLSFKFNKCYDQVDGVSISSSLGTLFAKIFMDEFEQKHMEKLLDLEVNN